MSWFHWWSDRGNNKLGRKADILNFIDHDIENLDIYKLVYKSNLVYDIIKPVFDTLNPFALHRIKFNATPRTTNIKAKPLHVDVSGPQDSQGNFTDIPDYHICVIYFNDNDGYTYFEDGQKVVAIENRAVIFSGDLLHAGTSCTDTDLRVVLNIDYCKWS